MSTTDIIALFALIIGCMSFFHSIYIHVRQSKYQKNQDELNRLYIEKVQKEYQREGTADVSANVVKISKGNYRIRVYNKGNHRAHDVTFDLVDSNWIFSNRVFPLEFLDVGKSVDMPLVAVSGMVSKAKCKITWLDKLGEQERDVI